MQTDNDSVKDGPKQITIIGTATRYQLKKALGVQPIVKSRSSMNELDNALFIFSNQLLDIEINPIYARYILVKLGGYKQQDLLKKRHNEHDFITLTHTIELLKNTNMTCYYCKCCVFILYKNARDMSQWSLDRIDNVIGHSTSNVVISCLKCNLQRRRLPAAAFIATKQMVINRI